MSFLSYLDEYEQKLNRKPEPIKETIIQKPITVSKPITESSLPKIKKIIKVIKKPIVIHSKQNKPLTETLSQAANILDGLDEGCSLTPSSSRYYDDSSFTPNESNINSSRTISNHANSLCDDLIENDSGSQLVSLTQPMMNVPRLNLDILQQVPREMLSESELREIQNIQPKQQINETNKQQEIPDQLKQMMIETERLQQMCNQNISMPEMPSELNYA